MTAMAVDHVPVHQTLQELTVPESFNNYENTDDTQLIVRLETWRQKACTALADIRDWLRERNNLTLTEKAEVVSIVAQFDGEEIWTLDTSRSLAQGAFYALSTLACCS